MSDTPQDRHLNCRCWKCWAQDNFTSLALFFVVLVGLGLLVLLIHEAKIDDKYVTWFEGFVAGAFSTWTLALKTVMPEKPHIPDQTVPTPPPGGVVKQTQTTETKVETPPVPPDPES